MYSRLSVTSLDEVKRLLDGEVDPEGLEINSELYEMAEILLFALCIGTKCW